MSPQAQDKLFKWVKVVGPTAIAVGALCYIIRASIVAETNTTSIEKHGEKHEAQDAANDKKHETLTGDMAKQSEHIAVIKTDVGWIRKTLEELDSP